MKKLETEMGRETTYEYLKRQTGEIALDKTEKGIRKWNSKIKWKNESFLIAAQNNAIRTNYIKATIYNRIASVT